VGEKRREEKRRKERRGRSKEVLAENGVVATINQLIKLTLFRLRHCPCTLHVFKGTHFRYGS
jgi:hypothetical protein